MLLEVAVNADGICFGDHTTNCGTGSAELLIFPALGLVVFVALLAVNAGTFGWRYIWLFALPARLRHRLISRLHLERKDNESADE